MNNSSKFQFETVAQTLGDFSITKIVESCGPAMPLDVLLPASEPEAVAAHHHWLEPGFIDPESGLLILSFHSYLIRTPRHTILVDTCVGNDKERPDFPDMHRLQTGYLDKLIRTGINPEQVDFVMCTHMHPDHVGWNTRLRDGRWVPTFPNAKYLFSRVEMDTWKRHAQESENAPAGDPLGGILRDCFNDSVLPVVEAGQSVLVDDGYEIEDGIQVEAAPGHTPGNVVINLASNNTSAVLSGDVLHHPLQLPYADWSSCFCSDPQLAAETRKELLDRIANTDILLMPAHFPEPTWGRVRGNEAGFSISFK